MQGKSLVVIFFFFLFNYSAVNCVNLLMTLYIDVYVKSITGCDKNRMDTWIKTVTRWLIWWHLLLKWYSNKNVTHFWCLPVFLWAAATWILSCQQHDMREQQDIFWFLRLCSGISNALLDFFCLFQINLGYFSFLGQAVLTKNLPFQLTYKVVFSHTCGAVFLRY